MYRDIVDENDKVMGKATKEDVAACGLICRVAFMLLVNSERQLLLQQRRATKKTYPLYWSGAAAGHLISGETYESGGIREVREELGVHVELNFLGKYLSAEDREMVGVLYGYHDGPFEIERAEVEQTKFMSLPEIQAAEATGSMKMTSFLVRGLDMLIPVLTSS